MVNVGFTTRHGRYQIWILILIANNTNPARRFAFIVGVCCCCCFSQYVCIIEFKCNPRSLCPHHPPDWARLTTPSEADRLNAIGNCQLRPAAPALDPAWPTWGHPWLRICRLSTSSARKLHANRIAHTQKWNWRDVLDLDLDWDCVTNCLSGCQAVRLLLRYANLQLGKVCSTPGRKLSNLCINMQIL